MFCKYCGKRVDEDSMFCSSCGRKIGEEKAKEVFQPSYAPTPQPSYAAPRTAAVKPKIKKQKKEEFIDIFEYWGKIGKLKKTALLFICTMVASWTAMLVVSVFFPNIIS